MCARPRDRVGPAPSYSAAAIALPRSVVVALPPRSGVRGVRSVERAESEASARGEATSSKLAGRHVCVGVCRPMNLCLLHGESSRS